MTHAWTFGIGKDARHEGWIRHFNPDVEVQSFDPTELSKHTIELENNTVSRRDRHMLLEGKPKLLWAPIAFHPTATELTFYTTDQAKRCYSLIAPAPEQVVHQYTVTCANVGTLLNQFEVPDYIKFDVEGMWYEFVCDVLDHRLFVDQLVGEFEMYYGDADEQFERLDTVIEEMQSEGYTVFTNRVLQTEMVELAFVKKGLLK